MAAPISKDITNLVGTWSLVRLLHLLLADLDILLTLSPEQEALR